MRASSLAPRRWPVVAALAGLALLVHGWGLYRVTGPPSAPWFPAADKLQHLVGFGVPLLLVLLALDLRARSRGGVLARWAVLTAVAAFAAHAVVSEVVQGALYTTRSGDPGDAVADGVGVVAGLWAFRALTGPAKPTRARVPASAAGPPPDGSGGGHGGA